MIEHWSPNPNKPNCFLVVPKKIEKTTDSFTKGDTHGYQPHLELHGCFHGAWKGAASALKSKHNGRGNKKEANMSNKIYRNICGIYLIHRDSYIWIPIWITIQHDLLTVSSTLPSHSRQVVYQTENFCRSFLTSPLLGSDTPGSVTQHSLVAIFPRYSQVRSSCSHSLEDNFFKKCQHVPSESNGW